MAALVEATGHAARAPLRQRLQHAGSRAVPALLKGLSYSDDFARWEAVNLLGILAPSRALDAVVAFALDEEERHARWRAFWAVTRFDRQRTNRILLEALGQSDPDRRWRAALMLSMMQRDEAVPVLLAGLDSRDRWVQWEALGAVKALAVAGAGRQVARFLAPDQPHHLRQEAVLALGAIPDNSVIAHLVPALDDREPQVRWRASMVLARHGPAVLPLLRKRLRRERNAMAISQLKDDIDQLEANHGNDT